MTAVTFAERRSALAIDLATAQATRRAATASRH